MATKTLKKAKKLTKAQMRVIVAKDALLQLQLEKYQPKCGVYIDDDLKREIQYLPSQGKANREDSVQPYLNNLNNCQVCAKGAIFLSSVRAFNDVTVGNFYEGAMNKAYSIFGENNLDRIECAFEQWKLKNSSNNNKNTKLNKFIDKYPHTNKRLEAILKNIIKNKGIFKP